MVIDHALSLDWQRQGTTEHLFAKQNDMNSRCVTIAFFSGGVEWVAPAGVTAVMCYQKPDGTSGVYDTLDGKKAYEFSESRKSVTVQLAPQMFAVAGPVQCELRLVENADKILNSFTAIMMVEPSATSGSASEDYFSYASIDAMEQTLEAHGEAIAKLNTDVPALQKRVEELDARTQQSADVAEALESVRGDVTELDARTQVQVILSGDEMPDELVEATEQYQAGLAGTPALREGDVILGKNGRAAVIKAIELDPGGQIYDVTVEGSGVQLLPGAYCRDVTADYCTARKQNPGLLARDYLAALPDGQYQIREEGDTSVYFSRNVDVLGCLHAG